MLAISLSSAATALTSQPDLTSQLLATAGPWTVLVALIGMLGTYVTTRYLEKQKRVTAVETERAKQEATLEHERKKQESELEIARKKAEAELELEKKRAEAEAHSVAAKLETKRLELTYEEIARLRGLTTHQLQEHLRRLQSQIDELYSTLESEREFTDDLVEHIYSQKPPPPPKRRKMLRPESPPIDLNPEVSMKAIEDIVGHHTGVLSSPSAMPDSAS